MPYSRKHYLKVLDEAKSELAGIDPVEKAAFCGFDVEGGGASLGLLCLGNRFTIDTETWDIHREDGRVMPLQMRIIVLHLLKIEQEIVLSGEMIPLKAMPGLELYAPVIRRRSEEILIRRFGDDIDLFEPAMKRLGGETAPIGDVGGRFYPLPRVPVDIAIYESEPGLPAESSVMFDSAAPGVMHLEDLVVIAELLSHKLANVALDV